MFSLCLFLIHITKVFVSFHIKESHKTHKSSEKKILNEREMTCCAFLYKHACLKQEFKRICDKFVKKQEEKRKKRTKVKTDLRQDYRKAHTHLLTYQDI